MNSGYATNYHYNPCSNNNDKNFFLSCHGKESFVYSVKIALIFRGNLFLPFPHRCQNGKNEVPRIKKE